MTELSIVSIVATGNIDTEIDLQTLSEDIEAYSIKYDPESSPGLYAKFFKDGPTITIYRTGSFNIRGASNFKEVHQNESEIKSRLNALGINESISNIEITNIVFVGDLEKKVNLHSIAFRFGLNSIEYEPEQFPGLVYRVEGGVILIFSSGKVVVTGYTDRETAEAAYYRVEKQLDNG